MTATETNVGTAKAGTKVMTLLEAITDALRYEMKQDDRVLVFGEDVGKKGGVFGATMGLQVATKANEKDAIYYEFFKLREERRYAVLESFPNEAAEHAHLETPWCKDAVASIIECLDGTYVREYLDEYK
jgi:quinol monooxygenase YgiN